MERKHLWCILAHFIGMNGSDDLRILFPNEASETWRYCFSGDVYKITDALTGMTSGEIRGYTEYLYGPSRLANNTHLKKHYPNYPLIPNSEY